MLPTVSHQFLFLEKLGSSPQYTLAQGRKEAPAPLHVAVSQGKQSRLCARTIINFPRLGENIGPHYLYKLSQERGGSNEKGLCDALSLGRKEVTNSSKATNMVQALWHHSCVSHLAQDSWHFSTFKLLTFCMPESDGELHILMAGWMC